MPASSTFDAICVRLTSAREQVAILNVYRPGSEKPSAQFFDELSSAVLETLVINACPVVIGGDFIVRFQLAADSDSRRLSDVLASFDMAHLRFFKMAAAAIVDLLSAHWDHP